MKRLKSIWKSAFIWRCAAWFMFCAGASLILADLSLAGQPRTAPPSFDPELTTEGQPTEQQVADECIKSAIAWVERIGPAGRDHNQASRRAALGQIFFRIAEVCSADAMFHPQRDFACEALRVYFPEIECWACEN